MQFTVSRDTYDKLRCAQDLLRHSVPDGDPAVIFDRALTLLVTELERRKNGSNRASARSEEFRSGQHPVQEEFSRSVWQ